MRAIVHYFATFLLILVVSGAHADKKLKDFEQEISDSVITTKITAKFTKNRNLNPLKIYVSTKDGVVSLRGHVNDRQAFVDALKLAVTTKGVKEVDTEELVIQQVNTAFTDAYLTARVETAILKAKVFDDESIPLVGINAKTNNGTVTLSGSLKQEKAVGAIIKRVSAIPGVKKIISRLQVNKDA
ncbi:BON domain-containing protein [Legionella jordanis]|uniref:Osmotically inducible protein Y n=1 Tax=Legionella jordanis TaxID=456 RepID=A0A0W0VBV0_9GAMM|nr:BON domain-containing protein [Legionella jordanis]KTD17582.1 osmotically inducible protein Y [Legionella jordanis]RMX00865.1 BON domain-containing protein [Legionella jordanis]VEH11496.1 osmotically inducible protein Y [Legionella jordanis]HAT8714886.1 BON domain-containing protein [Legionella jordanis]